MRMGEDKVREILLKKVDGELPINSAMVKEAVSLIIEQRMEIGDLMLDKSIDEKTIKHLKKVINELHEEKAKMKHKFNTTISGLAALCLSLITYILITL